MWMSVLFGAKTLDFSKFMVWPHRQGGGWLSQCGHFVDKEGGGVNLQDFLQTSFIDFHQWEISLEWFSRLFYFYILLNCGFMICVLLCRMCYFLNQKSIELWVYNIGHPIVPILYTQNSVHFWWKKCTLHWCDMWNWYNHTKIKRSTFSLH